MLKTTGSSVVSASRVDDDEVISGRAAVGWTDASRKLAKSRKTKSGNNLGESNFLTPKAKKVFNRLRQAFTKALTLRHFDPECHIWIETNASGYTIGGVLNQLIPNQVTLDEAIGSNIDWHPVAYFSRKMILAQTRYKTYNGKLLVIINIFKTWQDYLKGCKYKVLILTDHNNLGQFMDTKWLSSRQLRWSQELSCYHFQIDYCQGKANGASDALF